MLKSITLLGSSSGKNAGDAALISAIMDTVDEELGQKLTYEIPTVRPSYVVNNYHNIVKPISMMPWSGSVKMFGFPTYNSIMRTDLSLIFDAVLFDRSLYNPLFNFMSTLYLLLPMAKRRGKKYALFNVGTGPVNTKHGQQMLKVIADGAEFVTVRDNDSKLILDEIGVTNPRVMVTADAALNVPSASTERVNEILATVGFENYQEILGVNVNAYLDTWAGPDVEPLGRERFLDTYSKALNKVLADLQVPLLFVCTQHLDVKIASELMARVKSNQPVAMISNTDYNHYEMRGVLARLSMLVGMRLHAMILASAGLCPVVGLAYQPKCKHYFRMLGIEDRILEFGDFTVDNLIDLIAKGWAERANIKAQLSVRIPQLKNKAQMATKLVAALHRGENLDSAFAQLETELRKVA